MPRALKVSIGQYSDKGRKETNQDFHGVMVPKEPMLSLKGVAVALADGISSSDVSRVASESTVKSFLSDYYCTSDTWSVKTSAHRVIAATNSWLNAQTRKNHFQYEKDKGYVCTLSALVIKAAAAHLFHIGDSRIFRVSGAALEQLTEDHRVILSSEQSYLSRAMGVNQQIEIDYRILKIDKTDVFVLATDGVYEFVAGRVIVQTIKDNADDLDRAARIVVEEAYRRGSGDNLTIQIVRIDDVPAGEANEIVGEAALLPPPPLLEPRMVFDGYRIIRKVHGSSRSHIYLASDLDNNEVVVIKVPSIDLRDNADYLKRFAMEGWVARRINSAHVLKPCAPSRKRNYLYVATEFIDGQTLTQWMIDNPRPDLETVRAIVEQIARGLQAFHRMEMLHQDLRPENIMIDKTGTVKIIDFGSVRVRGVVEATPAGSRDDILGTAQYTAPEYFIGEGASTRSDIYSLGVITYQMLTGKLPYGAEVAKTKTKAQQRKLAYRSLLDDSRDIPAWIDEVLRKAVQPDPAQRYVELSEFVYELRHPNEDLMAARPLIERNPLLFWKALSLILAVTLLLVLMRQHLP